MIIINKLYKSMPKSYDFQHDLDFWTDNYTYVIKQTHITVFFNWYWFFKKRNSRKLKHSKQIHKIIVNRIVLIRNPYLHYTGVNIVQTHVSPDPLFLSQFFKDLNYRAMQTAIGESIDLGLCFHQSFHKNYVLLEFCISKNL